MMFLSLSHLLPQCLSHVPFEGVQRCLSPSLWVRRIQGLGSEPVGSYRLKRLVNTVQRHLIGKGCVNEDTLIVSYLPL